MRKPRLGDMVHYLSHVGEVYPAMIINVVSNREVNLLMWDCFGERNVMLGAVRTNNSASPELGYWFYPIEKEEDYKL